jgi:hypothetical protein
MESVDLTMAGWIFMISAWGILIGLVIFCMKKVLRAKNLPEGPEDEEE